MTKKRVFVVALAVCLLAILSVGSLAWFNDSDSITNDFFVGDSTNPNNKEFSVSVTETTGNTYYDALPGAPIAKDPKVTNTGDYTQWIRVKVTLSDAEKWAAGGGTLEFTKLFFGSTYGLVTDANSTAAWLLESETAAVDATADTATWYLYLSDKLTPGEDGTVFTSVKVPENFTQQEMAAFNNDFSITVVAEALQYEHTGDTAYEAFTNVGWTAGTDYQDT